MQKIINEVAQMKLARHIKTGNIYYVLIDNVKECTNGREDIPYVVYANQQGMIFCREREEFNQKFEQL